MKYVLTLLLGCTLVSSVTADERILLQRITALEKRVADLEEKLAPVLEEERVKGIIEQQQKAAHDRMMLDAEFLSRADLRYIETLYQTVNKDWKSEDAQKSLRLLVEKYPTANRTGCAILYMAQMTKGARQLDYLKQSIEKYSGCRYGNGVQVGAYARLYLGMRCRTEGNDKEAQALFNEVRTLYPDAIDHKGQLLTEHMKNLD